MLVMATSNAAGPPMPWRALTPGQQKEIDAIQARLNKHFRVAEFEQVAQLAEEIAAYRAQRQGAWHWQALDARFDVVIWQHLSRVPQKDRLTVLGALEQNG